MQKNLICYQLTRPSKDKSSLSYFGKSLNICKFLWLKLSILNVNVSSFSWSKWCFKVVLSFLRCTNFCINHFNYQVSRQNFIFVKYEHFPCYVDMRQNGNLAVRMDVCLFVCMYVCRISGMKRLLNSIKSQYSSLWHYYFAGMKQTYLEIGLP